MQYKVLLAGKNEVLVDEFFSGMDGKFTFQTTSERVEDILGHFHSFNPDVFLYCMNGENPQGIQKVSLTMQRFVERKIPLVVVGDSSDFEDYAQIADEPADMTIPKTLTTELIRLKLMGFLGETEGNRAETKAIEEAIPEVAPETEPEKVSGDMTFIENFMEMLNEQEIEDSADEAGPKKDKHILVVDDDVRMLKVMKEQLHNDYEVATAVSGKIALRFLANKKTDLIILDYEMPDEDGPTVLAKLRANPSTKDIPVIFLTGITKKEKIEKALVMKPQGYLLKPINRKKLMASIERIFNGG